MENLRRLRLKKHMTQVALQMETGIPQGALSKYERGAALPTADNLAALLEPALLVITGVIIGTLVVAMYLPVFHLGDAMSGMG